MGGNTFPALSVRSWAILDGRGAGSARSGALTQDVHVPLGEHDRAAVASAEGTALEVDVRGARVPVTVVERPFYKNASHR